MNKNIYFAGKIGQTIADDQLPSRLNGHTASYEPLENFRFEIVQSHEKHGEITEEIEIESGFIYCGPWLAGEHSIFEGHDNPRNWKETSDRCKGQIANCDAMFVWLNTLEAFGTLAEMGYAHAIGKPIFVGIESGEFADVEASELDFTLSMTATHHGVYSSPKELWEVVKYWFGHGKQMPKRITRKRNVIVLPGEEVNPDDCFVYLVREIQSGRLKIGTTQDLAKRLDQLQTGNPDDLEVVAWVKGSYSVEAMLHEKFSYTKVRGEWHANNRDILRWFYDNHKAKF